MIRLAVTDLAAGHGGSRVISGVTLTASAGTITTIAGPQGAGKTTLLRTIAGELRPVAGTIELDGSDLTACRARRRARAGIRLVPELGELLARLTVAERLAIAAGARGNERAIAALLRLAAYAPRLRQRADQLSAGEITMLALARALLGHPRVLLLDEPIAQLAPGAAVVINAVVGAAADLGCTVIATTSHARDAHPQTGRILHMRRGWLVDVAGSPARQQAFTPERKAS